MADPKKDAGKKDAKPAGGGGSVEGEIVFIIFAFVLIGLVVLPALLHFFGFNFSFTDISTSWTGFKFSLERAFSAFFSGIIFISVFLCLLFIIGIMYSKMKLGQIAHAQVASKERPGEAGGAEQAITAEMKNTDPLILPGNLPGATEGTLKFSQSPQNMKWVEIMKHMESGNQAEWRLAILEADIMLYDMLDQMGYEGDSIGEKLKQVEPSSFNTLDEAWRAHKVRNTIAHEGSSYVLPRSEAERTMRQFESVFKEFYFI